MLSYMSSSFLYTKIANLILWFTADPLLGIIYGIIFICKYLYHLLKEIIFFSFRVL